MDKEQAINLLAIDLFEYLHIYSPTENQLFRMEIFILDVLETREDYFNAFLRNLRDGHGKRTKENFTRKFHQN